MNCTTSLELGSRYIGLRILREHKIEHNKPRQPLSISRALSHDARRLARHERSSACPKTTSYAYIMRSAGAKARDAREGEMSDSQIDMMARMMIELP